MYLEQKFSIGELDGISKRTIEEHLKLYAGYVKHVNVIYEKIEEYVKDSEKHAYALGELQRRFGFEFDGMRNHEYYFRSLEGGPAALSEDSLLKKQIAQEWGSFDDMWEHSYYLDYGTEKKKYSEAFFKNLNWNVIENNFVKAIA